MSGVTPLASTCTGSVACVPPAVRPVPAMNALRVVLAFVLLAGLAGSLAVAAVGWCSPAGSPHEKQLHDLRVLCSAVSLVAFTALSVVQLVRWWTTTGKDQTAAGPPDLSRVVDLPPRTFRFHSVGFWAGVCRVFAVLFLLPLAGAVWASVSAASGWADGWPLAGVLGVLGVVLTPFVWLMWKLGGRYAGSRVVVDGCGVEVRTVFGSGRFGWGEITAFTREEQDVGAIRTQWFYRLYAGERVLSVEPWIREPDEFAELVTQATGLGMRVFPLNAGEEDEGGVVLPPS